MVALTSLYRKIKDLRLKKKKAKQNKTKPQNPNPNKKTPNPPKPSNKQTDFRFMPHFTDSFLGHRIFLDRKEPL